jgi:hypothetical protein
MGTIQINGSQMKVSKKKLTLHFDSLVDDAWFLMSGRENAGLKDLKYDPHADNYLLVVYQNGIP